MAYVQSVGGRSYRFPDLKTLLAKASPARSGDYLAGLAAEEDSERVAAQMALADAPLKIFLNEALIPYEQDEVTRLIVDEHDSGAFAPVSGLTVGDFRNWLLGPAADEAALTKLAPGLTPEMVAAVSKLMRVQDLILVARKCRVVTRFRDTIGLPERLSTRLQPNHPTDDPTGIAASILDGLLYGSGDAVIGINPATDSVPAVSALLRMLDDVIHTYEIPTQACVLTHVTTSIEEINRGVPVDRRHRGGEPQFRHRPRLAGRGTGGGAGAEARNCWRQCDVFRDRPGYGAIRQCASRRRSADLRGARLRRCAKIPSAAGQHGGRLHRTGISLQRQADHPRRA